MYEKIEKNSVKVTPDNISLKGNGFKREQKFLLIPRESLKSKNCVGSVVQRQIQNGKRADYAQTRKLVMNYIGAPTTNGEKWEGGKPDWINYDKMVEILMREQNEGTIEFKGEKIKGCICGICKKPVTELGIQVDHKQGWAAYLSTFGDGLTNEEAQILYNDLANLRIVHSRCNARKLERKQMVTRTQMKNPKESKIEEEEDEI
ncbi:HNH endonuclease signature motif containing protein [Vibrio coralliilyticus]|uniref:HNH endonuclease signature motif containing protein n=1 Tax=Vibrio coralliilyticus TaxID=190893 RepID=UPI0015618807|nr:HNH endonuclease signature motif containing protein [Vibrio coralliilyticus]NRF61403.1 HNH endonuclease [Vibrio coralliilyticus]